MSTAYRIGDNSLVMRGDLVDWAKDGIVRPKTERQRGEIIVIDGEGAWVKFPELDEPCRYPLHQLVQPSPPDFRTYFAERNNAPWPTQGGEQIHVVMQRIAETFADYVDELRKAMVR